MSGFMDHAATRRVRQGLAFTLVELLVVIGIIALLISILLPALNRARSSAALVACQANMHTIGQTVGMYVINSKGMLPIGYAQTYKASSGAVNNYTNWPLLLMNTLDSRLPTNSYDAYTNGSGDKLSPNTSKLRAAFFCSEVPGVGMNGSQIGIVHYMAHPRLMPDFNFPSGSPTPAANDPLTGKPWTTVRISKIKRSAEIAMIFDGSLVPSTTNPDQWGPKYDDPVANSMDSYGLGGSWGSFMINDGQNGIADPVNMKPAYVASMTLPGPDFNADTDNNRQNIRFRHMKNKVAAVLFADGHVGSFSLKGTISDVAKATDMPRTAIRINNPY